MRTILRRHAVVLLGFERNHIDEYEVSDGNSNVGGWVESCGCNLVYGDAPGRNEGLLQTFDIQSGNLNSRMKVGYLRWLEFDVL